MPQSLTQIWLHVVFSTKDRRTFLQQESFRDQMFRMLAHHVEQCDCVSASVGGHVDHVHLMVGLSRTITIASLVEHLKTETSKWAKKVMDGNRLFQWQRGYGAFSVSHSMKDKVDEYIRDQERHHAKRSFQDEYRQLCAKHGIETSGTKRRSKRPGLWPSAIGGFAYPARWAGLGKRMGQRPGKRHRKPNCQARIGLYQYSTINIFLRSSQALLSATILRPILRILQERESCSLTDLQLERTMNQKLRQTISLLTFAVALVIAVWPLPSAFSFDEMEPGSDELYAKFVDDWFERLSQAEPQTITAEFAAMVEASNEHHWTTQWAWTVAIRMVDENVHVEHAAEYLLEQIDSADDHPAIDLNQAVMNRLVPVLIARLESRVPPLFKAGKDTVDRFQKIPDEHAADIRALVWDWTDDPFQQVQGCRLIARLANVTQPDRDTIVECLESPDNIVVKVAIQAAATIGDPKFLPELQKRLNHVSEDVSIEAATAMLQIIERHPNDASLTPLTRQALNTLNDHYNEGDCEEVLEHAKLVPDSVLRLPKLLREAMASPAEIHNGGFFPFDTGLHVSASEILDAAGPDALPLIGQWLADSNTPVLMRQRLLSNLLDIDADQSALHTSILQQLQNEDEGVRTQTMRLLMKYGAVDAILLETVKADSQTSRLILISALGEASETTRQSAISFLRKSLEDESPDIRVAVAASLVKLGDMTPEVRGIPKQLVADLDELTWNEEGWHGFRTLMDLTKQIRPSPDGLGDELLKAVQAYPNRNIRLDTASLENEKGDSTEGTKEDEKRIAIAFRAAELLACLDDSAFDARIELSRHFNGDIRKEAISQLGASGDQRALFPIVTHLFDRLEYSFMISLDMGVSAEMRTAAIEALASPQLDVSPIASMLCDLLEEDWAAVHAAQALGRCRSSADQICQRLRAIELVKPDDRAISIGAAVAHLEKNDSRRWQEMTAVLRLLRQPKHAAAAAPGPQRSPNFLLQTLQTLHREGISIEPLRTELEFLAIDQPCLYFHTRAEIVTILAEISPDDPRWLSMLKFWRAQEDISFGTADRLIDTLPPVLKNKIR